MPVSEKVKSAWARELIQNCELRDSDTESVEGTAKAEDEHFNAQDIMCNMEGANKVSHNLLAKRRGAYLHVNHS